MISSKNCCLGALLYKTMKKILTRKDITTGLPSKNNKTTTESHH